MIRFLPVFLVLTFALVGHTMAQQDPDVPGMADLNEVLREDANLEAGSTTTLLLDNTRSKVGRDFYEFFFRAFNEAPAAEGAVLNQAPQTNPADTSTVTVQKPLEFELDLFLIAIDELPANSGTGSIISVSINDEVVFQQFIQNRIDTIEEFAVATAQGVRQYVDTYNETQRQLGNEDQKGSGVY
ncbi:CsgE family curli-type amyloid fiber assembly protein [Rudanella lutea]|uniref:CsgE family curli-type amyloid fiber assembly protein n=1 Tax=Rudanella lutea TaxID=451374 RepID=UPI000363F675|nr:CsgE family curli-type amyloid fiber assembly protein [Rudanella lutea]